MNKKERQRFWREVNKVELVIFFIIIFIFILILRSCVGRPSSGEVEKMYAQAAQDYLEEKYAEEFEINENMQSEDAYGLFPSFSRKIPKNSSYSGKSKKTGESVRVYITRNESSYKIEKMTDTYCLKHIRTLLQNYTIDMLSEELGEMKVNVAWHASERGFSKDITLESTIQELFESTNSGFGSQITIIIPNKNLFSENELENIVVNYVRHLKETGKVLSGTSSVSIAAPSSLDDYEKIETDEDENLIYANKRVKDIFYVKTQLKWESEIELIDIFGSRFSKID